MVIPYPNEIAGGDVSLRFLNVKDSIEKSLLTIMS